MTRKILSLKSFGEIINEFNDQIDADTRDGGISSIMAACVKDWFHKAALELQLSALEEASQSIESLKNNLK